MGLPYLYLYVYSLIMLLISSEVVVQFVEALRRKPGDYGFGSQWCHWNISLT
jgi:hypothetical protein